MSSNNRNAQVAYFSAEFGINKGIPVGGGLGILAGDAMKSASDLGRDVVGVTLLYGKGNFHQQLGSDGWQTQYYEPFHPNSLFQRHSQLVAVPIQERDVKVGAWELPIQSSVPGAPSTASLIYLTTDNHNPNNSYDERLCDILYPSDRYVRLVQETILALGGVEMLRRLGYKIENYHINESHAALVAIPLIERYGEAEARRKIVFTTHTPVPAGIECFTRSEADDAIPRIMKNYGHNIWELTGKTPGLHMMRLAMEMSRSKFGVSDLHAQVSKYLFGDFPRMNELYSVDNGIHVPTWASPEVQRLYDKYLGKAWITEPKVLERVNQIPLEEILATRREPRRRLGRFITDNPRGRVRGHGSYDPEKLTIGFARRFAPYKQATLALDQIDELAKLGNDVQFVFSGKTHPDDSQGKHVLKDLFARMEELKKRGVFVWFIEDYDMDVAQLLVQGVDLWLNTPQRYSEASGTSGMKAAANFVPHMSIVDGWWVPKNPPEGYIYPKGLAQGVTGWGIGKMPDDKEFWVLNASEDSRRAREEFWKEDSNSFITQLREDALPKWKQPGKEEWTKMGRAASAYNTSYFNTTRMVKELFDRVYTFA